MMCQSIKPTGGFVDESDFAFVKRAVSDNRFPQLVRDLPDREPEIAFGVSEHFDRILRMLNAVPMTPGQRTAIERIMALLAWSPAIATTRAYRRAWEDFLPSDDTDNAEGGGQ